jgi:hypothetical protein
MAFYPNKLRDLVMDSGTSYKESSRSFILKCPRCSKEKLYIDKNNGQFICFHCSASEGFKGKPEYVLTELLNVPIHEIRDQIYGNSFKTAAYTDLLRLDDLQYYSEEDPPESFQPLSMPYNFLLLTNPKAKRGVEYLAKRGIPLTVALKYGLRYCVEERRVIFPIEANGQLIGWQKRLVIPNEWIDDEGVVRSVSKALTSADLPKDRVLLGMDSLPGAKAVILVEGPIDRIKCDLCDAVTVASLGKAVSDQQLALILGSGATKVWVGLDPDAEDEVARVCAKLGDLELYRLLPPEGVHDLGDMDFDAVRYRFLTSPKIYGSYLGEFFKF